MYDAVYKRNGPQVYFHLREPIMNLKHHQFKTLNDLFDEFDRIMRKMEAANYNYIVKNRKNSLFPREYSKMLLFTGIEF